MQSHWTYCKENYPLVDIADPGLDHGVAQNTLRISIFYAYQSLDQESNPDDLGRLGEQVSSMVKPSTYIIRYISASNWTICNGIWKQHLQSCSNAEQRAETRPLRMIDNMNMDLESLTSIIKGLLPQLSAGVDCRCRCVWISTETRTGCGCCITTKGNHGMDRRQSNRISQTLFQRRTHLLPRRENVRHRHEYPRSQ